MAQQIVITTDPDAIDEGLRRSLDAVCGLERVGLLTRGQPAILDLKALAFEQMQSLQAIRTDVLVHHHAVKDCGAGG